MTIIDAALDRFLPEQLAAKGNVLRTYVMRTELEPDLAEQVWSLHLEAPLEVAEPGRAEVLATALEHGATVYDAVYIALSRDHRSPSTRKRSESVRK